MTMELDYNRDLYGVEHEAGPFEVNAELIETFTRSIGETNPVFTHAAAAQAAGYTDVLAPPTLVTMLVRNVELPDIDLKFGRARFHAGQRVQARAPIVAGDSLMASSHLKEVYPQDRAQRHHGIHRMGDHLHQPERRSGRRRPGILRLQGVMQTMADRSSTLFDDIEMGDEIGPIELVATDENVSTFCELWGNPMPNRFTSPGSSRGRRPARSHSARW